MTRAMVAGLITRVMLVGAVAAGSVAPRDEVAVRIAAFAYQPAEVHVKRGATVRWVNEDDEAHTVTADEGSFRSRGLDAGEGYGFTFDRAGRFPYHCALHPHMTGTVVVE